MSASPGNSPDPDDPYKLKCEIEDEIERRFDERQKSLSRRGFLKTAAAAGIGLAIGSAVPAVGRSGLGSEFLDVGGVTANTYRVTGNWYGGPESARSELVSELGAADAGARYGSDDTGVWYYWTGSAWETLPLDGREVVEARVADAFGDDMAAIQSAVDDLSPDPGMVLLTPGKSYPANSGELEPHDGITIEGRGATISAGTKDVAGSATTVIQNADLTNGNDDVTIRNLNVEGKILARADAAGEFCDGWILDNVRVFDVNDFGFHLNDLRHFEIADCETSNSTAGPVAGNDGIHFIDCQFGTLRGFRGVTGDDIIAFESNDGECKYISAHGISGTSVNADLMKFFTHSTTIAGSDVHHISITDARTESLPSGDACEFENFGSGEIHHVTIDKLKASNTERGIVTNSSTGVHHVTFIQPIITDVQQRLATLMDDSTIYEGILTDGGLQSAGFRTVQLDGDRSKLDGGLYGPSTHHQIILNGLGSRIQNAQVDATGAGSLQAVRVGNDDTAVLSCYINATNDDGVGSQGAPDSGCLIDGCHFPNNGIDAAEFAVAPTTGTNV